MSKQNEKYQSAYIGNSDTSIKDNIEKNNPNDNSIIEPSHEVKISTHDTNDIIDGEIIYTENKCRRNKKKIIIISSIIGVLIMVIIYVPPLCCPPPPRPTPCCLPPPCYNCCIFDDVIWIDYNVSSKIFKLYKKEETKTTFNFENNERRLNDKSNIKTITNEILFDIYEINNDLINAYIVILSREEFVNDKKIKSFNDTMIKDYNYNAVTKASFYQNGTISELSFPDNK